MGTPPLVGCTIVYADELAKAAVLANSFLRFHSSSSFAVLVLDQLRHHSALPNAKLLRLRDLGLDPGDEWRLPMLAGRQTLRPLLVPALLEALSRNHDCPIVYFSESTRLFAPLSDIFEKAQATGAPLATAPTDCECGDTGRSLIVAPRGAAPFLREWFFRLRDIAVASENASDFHDAHESVPLTPLREPGVAVSYANLNPETFVRVADGFRVDGEPLRSFDFRGYDPGKPHLFSRFLGAEPRILLSELPVVAELCDSYRQELVETGLLVDDSAPRRFEILPSGLRIDPRMLRVYRQAAVSSPQGAAEEPPSPFGPGGEESFVRWLNDPIDQAGKGVTRYMIAVYADRPDVKAVFPDPLNADAAAFRNWYLTCGAHELNLPKPVVPTPAPALRSKGVAEAVPVNVAGYFRAELGLGTAARSLVAALEAANIPINTVTFDRTANRLGHPFADRAAERANADLNIVCVNPDQIHEFAEQAGRDFWHGRYSIGVWFWEVEDFPVSCHHAFNYIDEIWVASDFMRQTFLKVSPKPVFNFRLPVLAPATDKSLTRADLNLPDNFVFLFAFDFLSVLERKNPLGLIEAFSKAFAPCEGPRLVIKTINGDKRIPGMEKLRYAIRARPDILLLDGYLGAVENATITALSDCYVSLHRSEGFGLTIAEAMALGKPAIATAYSGNLEFMTKENSYLVPARRTQVGPEREPYPAESNWSEPDVDAAASLLRHVYTHREEAEARGLKAAADLRSYHSAAVAGKIISDRLAVVRRRLARRGLAPSVWLLEDRLEELEARNKRLGVGNSDDSA